MIITLYKWATHKKVAQISVKTDKYPDWVFAYQKEINAYAIIDPLTINIYED